MRRRGNAREIVGRWGGIRVCDVCEGGVGPQDVREGEVSAAE